MPSDYRSKYDIADESRTTLKGTLGAEVARELGSGWRRVAEEELNDRHVELHGPDGERLSMNVNSDKPVHVGVEGWLPQEINKSGTYTSDLKRPHISVAMSRGAVTIAKEIKRRLLPDYLEVLTKARERADATLKSGKDLKAAAEEVARLLGVETPKHREHDKPTDDLNFYLSHKGRGYTRIRVGPGGYLSIETSGGIENLRGVVAALGSVEI